MCSCFLHRVVGVDRWYPEVNKSGILIQYTALVSRRGIRRKEACIHDRNEKDNGASCEAQAHNPRQAAGALQNGSTTDG